MGEAIPDRVIVAALRPFVRACAPLVDRLREADAFGFASRVSGQPEGVGEHVRAFLAGVHVPGTSAWQEMTPAQRANWWVNRVGRFTTIAAAVPGVGGVWAERLPIGDALGAASQGLLLCAIAGEYGHADVQTRVRLLAAVLFGRDISPELAAGHTEDRAAEDARTAELRGHDSGASEPASKQGRLAAAAKSLYRLGRALLSVTDELERRPRGRWYHRTVAMVPLLGAVGGYLGERSGLKRAAAEAVRWLDGHRAAA